LELVKAFHVSRTETCVGPSSILSSRSSRSDELFFHGTTRVAPTPDWGSAGLGPVRIHAPYTYGIGARTERLFRQVLQASNQNPARALVYTKTGKYGAG
jgi:hypothetical protein